MVGGLQNEVEAMKCMHCGSIMLRTTAPFAAHRSGYHLHWDEVPAWVCQQCGEPYFESREVELLQEALAAVDRETSKLRTAS